MQDINIFGTAQYTTLSIASRYLLFFSIILKRLALHTQPMQIPTSTPISAQTTPTMIRSVMIDYIHTIVLSIQLLYVLAKMLLNKMYKITKLYRTAMIHLITETSITSYIV